MLPTREHVEVVFRHLTGTGNDRSYNKQSWLPVVLVNTNGDCYCYGDPYEDPAWCLGNIFDQSLAQVLTSENFKKSAAAADRRIQHNCPDCPYRGSCNGYAIAEEHYNCRETVADELRTCFVERNLFAHIERRLKQVDLDELVTHAQAS